MLDDLDWPDPRELIFALLDGLSTPTGKLTARYEQAADAYGQATGPWPEAIITTVGSTTGDIDRIYQVTVEVFAPRGPEALATAEATIGAIAGTDVEAGGVYADRVAVRTGPVEVPHMHPDIARVTASLDVVVRPID